MTQREFFEKVVKAEISDEMTEQANKYIAALDKKNAARAAKPSKTQVANEEVKTSILKYLDGGKVQTAPDIAEAIGVSTQKASALARQLTLEGKLTQTEIKVPKKGKMKAYSLAVAETAE